jgi:hypothetical protein
MRGFLARCFALALLVPTSSAARSRTPNDGTLSVRAARGVVVVAVKGGVIGSFAQGRVIITDPVEGDGTGPIVRGDEWALERGEATTVYGGKGVRFRLIGGAFRIKVLGRGINLSVVGKGTVTLDGAGTFDDGTYSVNDGEYAPIPALPITFPLSTTTP